MLSKKGPKGSVTAVAEGGQPPSIEQSQQNAAAANEYNDFQEYMK